MEKKIQYTVSIYTENNVGLLNRISAIFLKRHINIESFTTSECEIENVFRFIIVVEMTESGIEKVIKQIEKQVDVIKAFHHTIRSHARQCLHSCHFAFKYKTWK